MMIRTSSTGLVKLLAALPSGPGSSAGLPINRSRAYQADGSSKSELMAVPADIKKIGVVS
jgi:hypothetical protein